MAKKISDLMVDNEFTGSELEATMCFEIYDPTGATDADKSGAMETSELMLGLWRLYPTKIGCVIDGGGVEIADGIAGDLIVPYDCTITGYTIVADQSGSIVVDLWNDTYANHPPTNTDSMCDGGTPITITTATKAQTSTLTGWDTTLAAGSILRFNVDSCTTITRVTIALDVKRTA